MALTWPAKDPDELLDYQINWAPALITDTIVGSTWDISGTGLVNNHDTNAPQTATIWLEDGTINQTYQVTNTITTAGGRIFQQTVNIPIQAK